MCYKKIIKQNKDKMVKQIKRGVYLMLFLTIHHFLWANEQNVLHLKTVYSTESLPDSLLREGLAGTFFGKQDDVFIMAGGSAFPDGKPWQNGKKTLSNAVIVFEKLEDETLNLVYKGVDLLTPICEGASVSLPEGLLCIGGQTTEGLSNQVLLLAYENEKIELKEYPSLPLPVKSCSAMRIGTKIYVVGGQLVDGTALQQFLLLDTEDLDKGWQKLPDFPLPVAGAMITAQQNGKETALYVLGGRAKNATELTIFYSSVYCFQTASKKWIKKQDICLSDGQNYPLAVGITSSEGGSHILLYGGDTGTIYNQVEKAINENNITKRDSLWINHSGFSKKVLVYNTVTDKWFELPDLKNVVPVAVATALTDGENSYIAGGETSPGIRSPYIQQLHFTTQTSFGWLNYLVLFVYFVGMLLLGFFFMKRNNNTEDYFKASGRIPWWAAGISIFATTLSAITFISIPAKTYATDWRMFIFNVSILLVVPIVIRYFLPFFRRFSFQTAYEYLEVRFNRTVRWLASMLFVLFMVSRIAVVLFLPSLALNAVTGIDIYLSIIIMGIVTIVYSTSGGIEAVVWGDVIQGFILVFGAIAAFVFMILGMKGGLNEFWQTSMEFHKFHTFDFRFDFSQPVFWVVLLGGVANSLITYTSDQSVVQRYMTTKDEKATSRSIWLNGVLSIPVSILFFIIGTGLFAFYTSRPEQLSITNPNIDSVFPQFIVAEMPAGLSGLLIAAIFAAAMSTLSSNINSSAAVITSDFFQTIGQNKNPKSNMLVARWSGIICGVLGVGMALVLATWDIASLWDQFNTFLGLLTSGLGVLFILGIFFPKVGAKATLFGIFVGTLILFLVKNNTNISFLLYGFIGMSSGILFGYLFSFVFPNKKEVLKYTWKGMKKDLK